MSFTGDLEHLPIVDVIQLLNSSRKSGILTVKGRKGESQLVFKDGYIVSANHLNNSVRIGELLVKMQIITVAQLEQALQKQKNDGSNRKPLIITMIELGFVREEEAYKGLAQLIEMTIVEILTWKTGIFTLEALAKSIECEFRYYPEKMTQEVNVNTQSILMDALRIFDEKVRDGQINYDEESEEAPPVDTSAQILSADDLGLSDIDHLSPTLPKNFTGIPPFDPVSFQREKLKTCAPHLPTADQEQMVAFLSRYTVDPKLVPDTCPDGNPSKTLIVYSEDDLFIHSLATVCPHEGVPVCSVHVPEKLDEAITSCLAEGQMPILLFDSPMLISGDVQAQQIAALRNRLKLNYPQLISIQLATDLEFHFILESYRDGVLSVLPRPYLSEEPASFVDNVLFFLENFPIYLQGLAAPTC